MMVQQWVLNAAGERRGQAAPGGAAPALPPGDGNTLIAREECRVLHAWHQMTFKR